MNARRSRPARVGSAVASTVADGALRSAQGARSARDAQVARDGQGEQLDDRTFKRSPPSGAWPPDTWIGQGRLKEEIPARRDRHREISIDLFLLERPLAELDGLVEMDEGLVGASLR
ncbi:MAG: hypothetical protein AAF772_18785, partial [Acidobacteriota bacterium]